MSDPAPIRSERPGVPAAAGTPSTIPVPPARLLQDWKQAHARARAYLAALAVAEADQAPLADAAVQCALQRDAWQGDAVAETLRALRDLLVERTPDGAAARAGIAPFTAARLARGGGTAAGPPPLAHGRVATAPPFTRGCMAPEWIERRFTRRLLNRVRRNRPRSPRAEETHEPLRSQRRRLPWIRVARRRRLLLGALVILPSIAASISMLSILPLQGRSALELTIVVFFGALFGWISIGFWTATLGFFTLLGRRRAYAITNPDPADDTPFLPGGRTAVVMPICEEPVDRVFAGLQAIHRSLERTGGLAHFDFFILSDSVEPDTFVKEEESWAAWCRSTGGFGRIFYRRRRVRVRRKSGNVADFCRRWGAQYRYMIMLDADSIMSGETLVRLVRMMERRPDAGMIQTAPTAVNRRSLFARVQQFSSRVYGPMFAAGLHYWQLGDGQYWGHNAIIRIAPFMEHCALPKLPGRPPLGGEILSHDFVEAALMGRAGWTLWLAFDIGGSYEEVPSTLLEEMKRDRRWCQGNLQHLRLLFTEGLFGAHRALFVNGVLSYVSALLWFLFLCLSTAAAIRDVLREPDYFPHGPSLFPEWPVWRPDFALGLLAVTGVILFLPKLLSIVLIAAKSRDARAYGGLVRLTLSVLLEIVLSSLLAPIRMVFHSRFVVQNLLGRTVTWRSQDREDAQTTWIEAVRQHGFDTLFASAWGTALFLLNPDYFWWVTPIIGALFLSIPTSVLASRVGLGDLTRRLQLFLIPEESQPPRELLDLRAALADAEAAEAVLPPAEHAGFVRAAVDPYVNALHRGTLGRSRRVSAAIATARRALLERALQHGPGALPPRQQRMLLVDPDAVDQLHEAVWALADRERAARWGRPGGAS